MTYKLISLITHSARKPHNCIWCPEEIKTGEKYQAEVSTYGDDFQTFDWHPECRSAAASFAGRSITEGTEFEPGIFKRGTTEPR